MYVCWQVLGMSDYEFCDGCMCMQWQFILQLIMMGISVMLVTVTYQNYRNVMSVVSRLLGSYVLFCVLINGLLSVECDCSFRNCL